MLLKLFFDFLGFVSIFVWNQLILRKNTVFQIYDFSYKILEK